MIYKPNSNRKSQSHGNPQSQWLMYQATLTVYFDNARVPEDEPDPECWKDDMASGVYASLHGTFPWNIGAYGDIVLGSFSHGTDERGCITAGITITFRVSASDMYFIDKLFADAVASEL